MAEHLVVRTYQRHEPRIGWLPFLLLLAALIIVLAAALEVGWVPNDRVIIPTALTGYLLALWLAGDRWPAPAAWTLLTVAGLGLSFFLLAGLWPPWEILRQGNPAVAQFWFRQSALFGDQLGGWAQAVLNGGRSTETMPFAFGLAVAAWFLGAFLGWTAARANKPALGLAALGVALALTTYFGRAAVYWVVAFVGIATVAIAIAQYGQMERAWARRGTDFSGEVRVELLVYAGTASLLLMSFAYALPAVNISAIAESFRRQPAVSEAEETLTRVFAGVRQPAQPIEEVARGGRVGVLPRAFLLGSDPALLEDVVLTATVTTSPGVPNPPPGVHWRATSYDVYTGRGWLRSPEREEAIPAGAPISVPPDESPDGVTTVTQEMRVAEPARTTFYTLGRIVAVDRPAFTYWRGLDDLVRARDAAPTLAAYRATSQLILPDAAALRSADPADVPSALLARYTELPESVPPRVAELAREVAGAAKTPYDQARALEAFLQQYPYSLDVGLPPPNGDMVDYFLFDLQTGFCDYYATAMVVMARSLGLPARLAIGFLPQPSDDQGQQVLRQLDSHSWAEVYFAGYGWVEFEPTAPIPGQAFGAAATDPPEPQSTGTPSPTPQVAIPDRAPQRRMPWPLMVAFAAVALGLAAVWVRRLRSHHAPPPGLDPIQLAYFNLQRESRRLGYEPNPAQTPGEFAGTLAERVRQLDQDGDVSPDLVPQLIALADQYSHRRYGPQGGLPLPAAGTRTAWPTIRRSLRDLTSPWRALRRRLGR